MPPENVRRVVAYFHRNQRGTDPIPLASMGSLPGLVGITGDNAGDLAVASVQEAEGLGLLEIIPTDLTKRWPQFHGYDQVRLTPAGRIRGTEWAQAFDEEAERIENQGPLGFSPDS